MQRAIKCCSPLGPEFDNVVARVAVRGTGKTDASVNTAAGFTAGQTAEHGLSRDVALRERVRRLSDGKQSRGERKMKRPEAGEWVEWV